MSLSFALPHVDRLRAAAQAHSAELPSLARQFRAAMFAGRQEKAPK